MGEHDVTSSAWRDVTIDTARARREKSKLRVVIGRMDGLALVVCALVDFDAFAKLTSEGAQAITWLVFMGVVFFVPYALMGWCAPSWVRPFRSRAVPTSG